MFTFTKSHEYTQWCINWKNNYAMQANIIRELKYEFKEELRKPLPVDRLLLARISKQLTTESFIADSMMITRHASKRACRDMYLDKPFVSKKLKEEQSLHKLWLFEWKAAYAEISTISTSLKLELKQAHRDENLQEVGSALKEMYKTEIQLLRIEIDICKNRSNNMLEDLKASKAAGHHNQRKYT